MTEPDTADYRRRLVADELSVPDVDALLDALDAARAERDDARAVVRMQESNMLDQAAELALVRKDRAKWYAQATALADVEDTCCDCHGPDSGWQERAEAAEARIAGLVELCRDMLPYVPDYFRVKWDYDAELAKLTEDQK